MSSIRFNFGVTNHTVSKHIIYDTRNDRRYRLLQPIGHWDYQNTTTIYKATLLPSEERTELINPSGCVVAAKLCHKVQESHFYDLALEDANRSKQVRHANILSIIGSFDDPENNDIFYIIMYDSHCINLRALMLSSDTFKESGLPEDCIAVALRSALTGLAHIHSRNELHRQITGTNIVFFKYADSIKITFAASAYVRTDVTLRPDPVNVHDPNAASSSQPVSGFLPYRDILKWGRAPEVVEDDLERYKTALYTAKSDIWLIGITALEFAYGDIRVSDRNELLEIARCISVTRKMASTWEGLLAQNEEFKTDSQKPPKGKGKKIEEATVKFFTKRFEKIVNIGKGKEQAGEGIKEPFSKGFVKLVAKCLNEDPERRPTAEKLLKCKFLKKAKTVLYFRNVVVTTSRLFNPPIHQQ